MLNVLLTGLCFAIGATGLFFIFIELRSSLNRSFLYFGVSTVLLSFFAAIDIVVLPATDGPGARLYWVRIQHMLACVNLPVLYGCLFTLMRKPRDGTVRVIAFGAALLTLLFSGNWMLHVSENRIRVNYGYIFGFVPVYLFVIIQIHIFIVSNLKKVGASERRVLAYHLAGFSALCVAGTADLLAVSFGITGALPNYTIFGILLFLIVMCVAFAQRLLFIMNDHTRLYQEIRVAYGELEAASTLKELGKSTAIINHEIKNYMFLLHGNAQLLLMKEPLSDFGRERVNDIMGSAERMISFSKDILDLSKAEVIDKSNKINIRSVIEQCIAKNFAPRKESFILPEDCAAHYGIFGDWTKLDHVFLNLFKNAFEAGASQIRIQFTEGPSVVCVSVSDNGDGCDGESLQKMFTAFYTTKPHGEGTGLGLSLCRSIIEAHGGKIRAYSAAGEESDRTGMNFILLFPLYKSIARQPSAVGIIKEGIDCFASALRILQNSGITPRLFSDYKDITSLEHACDLDLLLAHRDVVSSLRKHGQRPARRTIALIEFNDMIYALAPGAREKPRMFSEQYVLENLCVPTRSSTV